MNSQIELWITSGIFLIFSIGLLIDIFFAAAFWDKLPEVFRISLKKVSWSFKDVLKISIGISLVYAVFSSIGFLIVYMNKEIKTILCPIINIIAGTGLYGISIWFILDYFKDDSKLLGNKTGGYAKGVFKSFMFYLGFMPILIFLAYIGILICAFFHIVPQAHPLIDVLKKEKSSYFVFYLIFVAVFIAPVFEELLFRGVIYQTLKSKIGFWGAAVISSIFFSLLHFNSAQFLPIAGLGVLLCVIFESIGSIVPVIALHIFNNALFMGLFFIMEKFI